MTNDPGFPDDTDEIVDEEYYPTEEGSYTVWWSYWGNTNLWAQNYNVTASDDPDAVRYLTLRLFEDGTTEYTYHDE